MGSVRKQSSVKSGYYPVDSIKAILTLTTTMLTMMTIGNNDDDGGNMLTMMASGNSADDDDDDNRCWPGAHQATGSPDSFYLDLSISVPWQILLRNMKELSREVYWPAVGASGLGNLKTGARCPPGH